MIRTKQYRATTWLTSFSLMVSLCLGILVTDRASAQTASGVPQGADQPVRANQDTYPELARYATDLTALARAGRLEPVVGRNIEISRTVEILSLDIRNNPVLVGEPGLGVAEVAQGLAQRIATGEVPESLRNKRLFSLSLDALVARAKNSKEFTTPLQAVLAEVVCVLWARPHPALTPNISPAMLRFHASSSRYGLAMVRAVRIARVIKRPTKKTMTRATTMTGSLRETSSHPICAK